MAMGLGTISNTAAELFRRQQLEMASRQMGASAQTPSGAVINCAPKQDLEVHADGSASCKTPVDSFMPSQPPLILMPKH